MCLLPSPLDIGAVKGIIRIPKKTEERKADDNEPLAALAFKIATDPYVGRLTYLRVYSGAIDAGMTVLNPRTGKKERINRLYQMHANKQNPRERIEAGDICGVVGLKMLLPAIPCVILNIRYPGVYDIPRTGYRCCH